MNQQSGKVSHFLDCKMHQDFEVKCRKKNTLYTFEAQFTNVYPTKWQGSIWFLLVTESPKILITIVLLNITDTLSEVSLSSNSLSASGPSRELLVPHSLKDLKNCLAFHIPYLFKISDAMCSYPVLYIKDSHFLDVETLLIVRSGIHFFTSYR
jgi:hypothetical protein